MKSHDGSQTNAWLRRIVARPLATAVLALACLLVGMPAAVASAAPAAPVISGPARIQFSADPDGFVSTLTWDAVPGAVEYRVYHAETNYYVGSVTEPSCEIFGMEGFTYHHYVVAVDSAGATSPPSNQADILTSAPVPPAGPAGFDVIPLTIFGVQTSSAPLGDLPVKIPYDSRWVTGDPATLRMMHYNGTSWVDVTTSVDTANSFVYGKASADSVFAVMQPNGSVVPPGGVEPTVSAPPPVSIEPTSAVKPVPVTPPVFEPVWRLYNKSNGTHFYTASEAEKNSVVAEQSQTYSVDGVAYQVNVASAANSAPLFRFYNKKNGSHFYTSSVAEKNNLIASLSATYSFDGPAYGVSLTAPAGSTTVWRFFNKKNGAHFYTASEAEKASVMATLAGTYTLEGPAFYLAP